MKKALLVFGFVVFATLMLPGLVRPPAESMINDKVRARALVHALHAALEDYHKMYGGYPEGTPGQIMLALRGTNEKGNVFLECPLESLNEHGELVDPWGTPFRIAIDPHKKTPHVRSAGPNMIMEEKMGHWMSSDDVHGP
jgi:hypothetical protein